MTLHNFAKVILSAWITVLAVTREGAAQFVAQADPRFTHAAIFTTPPSSEGTQTAPPGRDVILRPVPPAQPGGSGTGGDLNLFGNFGNNILDSFRGTNIYLHGSAVALTALIVATNTDYEVEHYFNTHPEYGEWAHPVVFTGEYLPFVAAGSLFAFAKINRDDETLGASLAVMQASIIELIYNSTLKAITGRPHPDWRHTDDMRDLSKTFRFGFLRGGIFWGWPSGHTASTMAVVSALTSYYPGSTWLKIAGSGLVAYTIFGVSATNRGGMHWFSDAVAAALMSYAVGSTVGKYYRSVFDASRTPTSTNLAAAPEMYANPPMVTFTFSF